MLILRSPGWNARNAPRTLGAVLCTLALLAGGCSNEGLGSGDAATVMEGSTAQVAVGDGWSTRTAGETIDTGARVRATNREVALSFRDGEIRLSPGTTALVTETAVELERGQALIDGSGALGAVLADTTVRGDAVFRVASGLGARVGVYEGVVTVTRPAQTRNVAALRQLDLSAFRLASVADPLQYRDGDAWDQELLTDAIAFDEEAARLRTGIQREVGTAARRSSYYRRYAPGSVVNLLADTATATRGQKFGPPSDILFTVFVSKAAAGAGNIVSSARRVTTLRTDGARWGLIAIALDVPANRVVAAIDRLGGRQLALSTRTPEQRTRQLARADTSTNGEGPADTTTPGGEDDTTTTGTPSDPGTTTTPPGDDPAPTDPTEPKDPGTGGGGDPDPPGPGGGGGGGNEDPSVEQVVSDVVTTVETGGGGGIDGPPPPPDSIDDVVSDVLSGD